MTTVQDITFYLDSIAPFDTQETWDNSGFLIGSAAQEVTVAALTLDITPETVQMAKAAGAQLLISHHPVIFRPIKAVKANDPVYALIAAGLSAVCAHTNLDAAQGGVNDRLALRMGLTDIEPLPVSSSAALLRKGTLPREMTALEFAALVGEKLSTRPAVAAGGRLIRTVAVCGGAGGEFVGEVAGLADAYLTGEVKHHEFLLARQLGLTVAAAGHFETETPVLMPLARQMSDQFSGVRFLVLEQSNPVLCL